MQVSGQGPGRTSGAYNRSLCDPALVLSRYPGARAARLADVPDIGGRPVRFFAVVLVPRAGLALSVPAAGRGSGEMILAAGPPLYPPSPRLYPPVRHGD